MKDTAISNTSEPAPRPKKTPSARQLAANRANAQKSTGPKTPEGKAIARFNSLKHGLTAKEVCLPGESQEAYDLRRQEYFDDFRPASLLEADILDDYVAARWRKARAISYEKCLLLEKMMQRRVNIAEDYESITPDAEAALAFRELSDESTSLKNLDRYETRTIRNIQMAFNQLAELKANRPPAAPDVQPTQPVDETPTVQNEANPEIEHPAEPEPIPNSTDTVVIPKKQPQPAQKTMVAGQSSPLTREWAPFPNSSLATSDSPLATRHSSLSTSH